VTQTLTRTLKSQPLLSYDKRNMYVSGLGNIFLFLVCPFFSSVMAGHLLFSFVPISPMKKLWIYLDLFFLEVLF